MNSKLKTAASLILMLIAIASMICVYRVSRVAPNAEDKRISVSVTHSDGDERQFTIETEAENLRAALEEENLISGSESAYGLFVETVDGETADSAASEWWKFSKDGEALPTGVDDMVIADGDCYEITFTVGW